MKRPLLLAIAVTSLMAGSRGSLIQRVPASAAERANPLEATEDNRRAGQKLFLQECAACHGRQAQGRGKFPPLASPFVRQAPPGKLFWILRNGSLFSGMPSFAHLPEAERWQIITFLQSPGS